MAQCLCLLTQKGKASPSKPAWVRTSLSQVVFNISLFTFISEVLATVMVLGRNALLKFVSILDYNNISKLQYL